LFRDTLGASVEVAGAPYKDYTVFIRKDGRHATVITNDNATKPISAAVKLDSPAGHSLTCASPEDPEAVPCTATVKVPPRSTLVLMEN
jgi:hypothetical protein